GHVTGVQTCALPIFGQIVAGGALNRGAVEQILVDSALAAGLTEREARATIASGLRAGADNPRRPPERETVAAPAARPTAAGPSIEPEGGVEGKGGGW